MFKVEHEYMRIKSKRDEKVERKSAQAAAPASVRRTENQVKRKKALKSKVTRSARVSLAFAAASSLTRCTFV